MTWPRARRWSFADVVASSRDHSVCDATKWVEGRITICDNDPQLPLVHPNALGQRNAADHVERAMLNAISWS